ncbi:zinc-dependent metalloprotease [bacterium]|nr:zinc-dependent metalloprotease [bacterium]
MMNPRSIRSAAAALLFLAGCQQQSARELTQNLVTNEEGTVDRTIGTEQFRVLDLASVDEGVRQGTLLSPTSAEGRVALNALSRGLGSVSQSAASAIPPKGSLVLGFPVGLLGENYVFGGVITKVSDAGSETLGQLKLTDLPPIPVTPIVAKASSGDYLFALLGCTHDCKEGSEQEVLATLPVVGIDTKSDAVLVDIASLGDELNLVQMLDPKGDFTQLKTKTNATVAFDYSYSTLVFDVETAMEPLAGTAASDTVFTVRWYLRLMSTFDPSFVSRPAAPGVGFFMTERSSNSVIQRFPLPRNIAGGETPRVHYYVKGVPAEYQPAFSKAFDAWNAQFVALLGKKLLSYEFVDPSDARYNALVPGDIRYNIVEWDTANKAPYGGLGPSIANQFSGEILSANVLIQGPTIVALYTKWFEASTRAIALREAGDSFAADALMQATAQEIASAQREHKSASDLRLSLGKIPFRVVSRLPSYQDPLFQRDDFEEIPAGFDYATYMDGYFQDMVAHELGHNLGLRHNFRGNLGATSDDVPGGVSASIMEYLGRGYRHLSRIGVYDTMAISYGYSGIRPARQGMFCTDEQVGGEDNPKGSAECSRDDATADPFAYFEKRLTKSIGLLTAAGTADAPAWKVDDMERELSATITGLGLYATSAATTSTGWTQFSNRGGRPNNAALIPAYVMARLEAHLCDRSLNATVRLKRDRAAKQATQANIQALRVKAKDLLGKLGIATTAVSCLP